ncbi:MAG: TolC family protein [Candidatus Binataceae bacterium]
MEHRKNRNAGGLVISASQAAVRRSGRRRRRRFLTLVVLAISASVGLAGCATIVQEPEVDPARWAPRNVDHPWTPAADVREQYAVPADLGVKATTPLPAPGASTKSYELSELVDLALRRNPDTRQAWASARAAAAAFGSSKAPYYPQAGFQSDGGYQRFMFQDQMTEITIKQWEYTPLVQLTYTLLDFGRRSASADAARQQLAAANFLFDRKIQDVVFNTEKAFFALSAAKAAVEAARKNLELTRTNVEAVNQRLELGLATEPALLLARQRYAQSGYDLESAKLLVHDAQADLAVALGVAANAPLDVQNFGKQQIPSKLDATVDQLIDLAVKERPDLAAQVAALRQREAELRRMKAAWYPTVGLSAGYGEDIWSYNYNSLHVVETRVPQYSALVTLQWDLFTGLRRLNDVRQAAAERDAARAEMESFEVGTIAQVWRSYYQFKSALKKYEYAQAILTASKDSYDANFEAYQQGLTTIVELLAASNDLANARYTLIQSKADLLTASAAVAYAAGAIQAPANP